mmetsp:Transcript_88092/g.254246  ORF Transcript_88092/g.254246 Transcript_88092/m.254246 type:complete len:300 (+) Transcript_88092:1720-2619(+)
MVALVVGARALQEGLQALRRYLYRAEHVRDALLGDQRPDLAHHLPELVQELRMLPLLDGCHVPRSPQQRGHRHPQDALHREDVALPFEAHVVHVQQVPEALPRLALVEQQGHHRVLIHTSRAALTEGAQEQKFLAVHYGVDVAHYGLQEAAILTQSEVRLETGHLLEALADEYERAILGHRVRDAEYDAAWHICPHVAKVVFPHPEDSSQCSASSVEQGWPLVDKVFDALGGLNGARGINAPKGTAVIRHLFGPLLKGHVAKCQQRRLPRIEGQFVCTEQLTQPLQPILPGAAFPSLEH